MATPVGAADQTNTDGSSSDPTPGAPPDIQVVAYSGTQAILYVRNVGGSAIFTAEAQIRTVTPGSIRHTAPYMMLWQNPETHKVLKGHSQRIEGGRRLKLLVAEWESGGDWGKPSVNVIGDEGTVDRYRHDPYEEPSPTVVIEVRIESSPPLRDPFTRRFAFHLPARTIQVVHIEESEPARD